MFSIVKRKQTPIKRNAGRPKEGRERIHLFLKPESKKDLDARAAASTRGKIVEQLLEQVPPNP